jgi:hypothetical protein
MQIKEEVAVTTTNNAGAGLTDPKLPLNKQNVFRRYMNLKKKKSMDLPKS